MATLNTMPPNSWPPSSDDMGSGGVSPEVLAGLANKADIATDFSDLTNYNAGDLVYYDGVLYEFQVDHTAGAWETSEVIQKDLSDIVTTLKSGLTKQTIYNNIANSNVEAGTIAVYKIAGFVVIQFSNVKSASDVAAMSSIEVGTIEASYRPNGYILMFGEGAAGGAQHMVRLGVNVQGQVSIANYGSDASRLYANGLVIYPL